MSSAGIGQNDGFLLYMFEEDLKMIENLAAEYRERNNGDIPCYGDMYGLWTNSRNPVVHLVLQGNNNPVNDYPFLQSPQFQNDTAKSMFNYIGCWSFKNPTERHDYGEMMNKTSNFVSLKVEQKENSFAYRPILFRYGREVHGRIEPLKGRNPFRLPDTPSDSSPETENVVEEKKDVQATLVSFYDKVFTNVKAGLSHGFAFVVNKGNVENTSKVPEGRDDYHETPASSSTFPSQDVQDVSTCTKRNQWYLTANGQEMLQEISTKLKELLNRDPKISRDSDTHNAMILFSSEKKNYVILFPPNFPSDIPVQLYCQTTSRTGCSYASSVIELKSRDPFQLVGEIIETVSK